MRRTKCVNAVIGGTERTQSSRGVSRLVSVAKRPSTQLSETLVFHFGPICVLPWVHGDLFPWTGHILTSPHAAEVASQSYI